MDQTQYVKHDLRKLAIALVLIAVLFGVVLVLDNKNGFVDRIAAKLHNATLISS